MERSQPIPAAAAKHARWAILMLLFLCRTSLGVQFQTVGAVSNQLAGELGLSFAQIGTLIGLFMLPGIALSLPSGYAARFVSDRFLVGIGLLAMGIGGGLAAIAPGFGLLAVGRLACGAGFVICTIYFTKMAADWFADQELATAMGVLVMSWPFGIAIGQIGHQWLATNVTWRAPFAVAAGYSAAAAALIVLFYRPPEPGPRSAGARATALPRRELALTAVAALAWAAFNAAYILYLSFAPRVLGAYGYSPAQAAAVISLASWVMIFSGALCGYIADWTGRPDRVLYGCMAVAIGCLLLLPYGSLAIGLSLLFGLVGMAPAGIIMALTGQALPPARRAFGMGVFFTGYFLLVSPAPTVAGWLYDRSGDPFWPIVLAAGLLAVTALANLTFRAAQRRLAPSQG